jgi:hypothetical protein
VSRWHLITAPLIAATALAAPGAGGPSTRETITHAVLSPIEALANRDGRALCSDFTPTVAANLVPNAPAGTSCESAAGELLASATPYVPPLATLAVHGIHVRGDRASATLVDTKVAHMPHKMLVELEVTVVNLREVDGRWLLATPARLAIVNGCGSPIRTSGCPPGAHVVVLVLVSSPDTEPLLPPIPAAVRHAGGKELNEFEVGQTVYAQSGCAACHKIGSVGNKGPGPNLTHIAARLSRAGIEKAIIDPTEPMPSFRRLPAAKLRAVVRFLSLLR